MKMKSKEEDEVEQLLQATQDHFLLNLSLNSHTTHSSPSLSSSSNNYDHISLDLDLERRFQALKGKNHSQNKDQELNSVLGHDLSARFAALKGKSSSSSHDPLGVGPTVLSNEYEEESEDEEDQVQKLIEWAKDAARLDPSPPSDEDEDDSDEDEDNRRRKRK
ncbi:hypothetical protein TanjilG_22471 [Lupinus angustifolius]|uniref:Uncharacterized protein n=2 Tax=Lupinus angustifolius TaxID=3871 RepID=A0A4P1RSG9_LUPAN|nr:hypothetical protein TanjilG_22471 [Lupinus angustifolius]